MSITSHDVLEAAHEQVTLRRWMVCGSRRGDAEQFRTLQVSTAPAAVGFSSDGVRTDCAVHAGVGPALYTIRVQQCCYVRTPRGEMCVLLYVCSVIGTV